ncbi:MAG: sulfatase-like hydrolase/transferase [Armatimonadota bacterium]
MLRKAQLFFLILIGSYPPLHLYARNQSELELRNLAVPLALSVGVGLAVALSWYPIMRDWTRSALMAGWLGFSFWLAGYMSNSILFSSADSGIFEGTCSVLIFAAIYLIGRNYIACRPDINRKFVSAAAMISGILVLFSLLSIIPTEIQRMARSFSSNQPSGISIAASSEMADTNSPNIIDIVLDGYARGDVLESRYGQSNDGFLNALRQRGFHIVESSTTNYSATAVSLTSILNMDYIKRPDGFIGNDMEPVKRMISDNAVFRYLRGRGYWTMNFSASCTLTEEIDADERRVFVDSPDQFQMNLVKFTPFRLLMQTWARGTTNDPYEIHRRQVTNALNGLAVVNDVKKPIYAFAHVICPHPPFIFNAEGQPAEAHRLYNMMDADDFISLGGTKDEYRKGYREQVTHLNKLVLKSIDKMQKLMHRPAIIIIHSDHGPGLGFDFKDIGKSDLKERMSNLMAIRFPNGDYNGIYPTITGVNIYRVVLSKYFGADLPLLPDKHFFVNWRNPYDHTPITLKQINKGHL